VKEILSLNPTSVLEVGCNTGPNLLRLAKELPSARLVGIDVSSAAIVEGTKRFKAAGIANVELFEGKAEDLGRFADDSFDVVFTDAVLIYVGKDWIETVVGEMLRVANKAIVLVEYDDPESDPKGRFILKKGYWKRNYTRLFEGRSGVMSVETKRLTKELWDDEYWSTLGAVVKVYLKGDMCE